MQPGTPGYFEAARHVRLLEVPAQLDRAEGDVHAAGNPHIQTDPRNIAAVAAALAARMQQLDPANAAAIAATRQNFMARWAAAMQRWAAQAAPLRGMPIAVYHKNWAYLEDWLGLREVGDGRAEARVCRRAASISRSLSPSCRRGGCAASSMPPMRIRAPPNSSQQRIGVPAIMLPFTVGGSERATDLFGLFDDTIDRLVRGLGGSARARREMAILLPAFLAGLLVLATHVPLGQLVLERGIVFIDLAIAQVAGLGVVAADAMGWEPQGWSVQVSAVSAALLSAAFLLWSERRMAALQEAMIGVVFVVAASAELILLGFNPHGAEHLKDLLVGQILWVEPRQLIPVAAALRRRAARRSRCSTCGGGAALFYLLFAVTITASVQLIGVFLVFASLILPALAAASVQRHRLGFGYLVGLAGYALGLVASFVVDLPTGAAIVCALAIAAALATGSVQAVARRGRG